jgi:ABC-type transporter Mla MlaB component
MPFSIIFTETDATRMTLEGDLEVSTVDRPRPELLGAVRSPLAVVKVDLSRLRSVNPQGMQVLVELIAGLARAGCRITVKGPRDQTLKCFKAALGEAIVHASQLAN